MERRGEETQTVYVFVFRADRSSIGSPQVVLEKEKLAPRRSRRPPTRVLLEFRSFEFFPSSPPPSPSSFPAFTVYRPPPSLFPRHRLLVIAATNTNFVVIIRSRPRLKEAERKKPCVYPLQNPLERRSSCHRERERDFFRFLSVPLARARVCACVYNFYKRTFFVAFSTLSRISWNRICSKWGSCIRMYTLFYPFLFFWGGGGVARSNASRDVRRIRRS